MVCVSRAGRSLVATTETSTTMVRRSAAPIHAHGAAASTPSVCRYSSLPLSSSSSSPLSSSATTSTTTTTCTAPSRSPSFLFLASPFSSSSFSSPPTSPTAELPQPQSQQSPAPPAAAAENRPLPTSSCKAGTVLKGINVFAGKSDPVALADSEYPAWLWRCLDPDPRAELGWPLETRLDAKYIRLQSRKKIRENAIKLRK
ncbi:mitochondrial ribosomal protein L37-domain-containing protein [Zopfochytrium polystomum]|nr:mitochondrial ribosomal protein L37-domain-containing protein [Zopfochytrium polystomum]